MEKQQLNAAIKEMLYGFQLVKQSELEAEMKDENFALTYSEGWKAMVRAEKTLTEYIKE